MNAHRLLPLTLVWEFGEHGSHDAEQNRLRGRHALPWVFVFSLQDAVIKSVSGAYALTEVVSIRCLVSAPILLAFVWWENRSLKPLLSPHALSLAARSAIMLLAYTSYYMAFPALPLADAVALYFTVPLFMLALAAPLLGEIITPRKVVAALIGFAGVLVMLRPGLGVFEPRRCSRCFGRHLCALHADGPAPRRQGDRFGDGELPERRLSDRRADHRRDHPCDRRRKTRPSLAGFSRPLLVLADARRFPRHRLLRRHRRVGVTLLTQAYRVAKASIVGSFEYTGMLWAPLWGFLFFGEIPHLTTLVGRC